MSDILDYLTATREAEGPRGWTRREPRTTHPEILALTREAIAAGLFYNDDVERFVAERVGDLPEHREHGHVERDPLTYQLGSEVYLARSIIKDEESQARADALTAEGFVPLDPATLEHGRRYLVRFGTLYVGQSQPSYSRAVEVRANVSPSGIVLLPKGARTRGYAATTPALVRPI